MCEIKQLRCKMLGDFRALQQDNDSFKRRIVENEKKMRELKLIVGALEHLIDEVGE